MSYTPTREEARQAIIKFHGYDPDEEEQEYKPDIAEARAYLDKVHPKRLWQGDYADEIRSAMQKVPGLSSVVAGLAGLGHEALNAPHNLLSLVNPEAAKRFPQHIKQDYASMTGAPDTLGSTLIQEGIKIAPLLAMNPSMGMGRISAAIAKNLPKTGKAITEAFSRIIPQGAIGAAISDTDQKHGALQSAGVQTALEAAPFPFRGIGAIAEHMHPQSLANQKLNELKQGFDAAKTYQKASYEPVMQAVGHEPVTENAKRYLGFNKELSKHFTHRIKKSLGTFKKEPNFQNLHDLQSMMGMEASALRANRANHDQVQAISEARNTIANKKIPSFLVSQDNKLYDLYGRGRVITRDIVEPYNANNFLAKIAEGKIKNTNPSELHSNLVKAIQGRKNIHDLHPIRGIQKELETAIQKGKATQDIGASIAGAGLGGYFLGPSGIVLGALGSKFLAPKAVKALQNPQYVEHLKKLLKSATPIARGINYNNIENQ